MKKLLLLFVVATLFTSCQKEVKTAFVKTETIFKDYKGVKAQEAVFKQKQEAFQKKYQALAQQWQKEVTDFQQKLPKMNKAKAQKMDQELYRKQQQIQQMQQQESAAIADEMQKQTDSIIKKVYDFIADYGKKNGYKYIYGENKNGGLMYGEAKADITDAVLKALDTDFGGEAKADDANEEKAPAKEEKKEEEKK